MSFWLSHHPSDEFDRTYTWRSVHVCARCLGTYPAMLLSIAWQLAVRAPLAWAYDVLACTALILPALLDWAHGRFRPHWGTNTWRSLTGLLLGLGMGRSLYIHLKTPWPIALRVQAALVTAVAIPVILARYRNSRAR